MPEKTAKHNRFRNNYVLILTLLISAVFLAMIWTFLQPLLVAAITAALLQPIYRRLVKFFRGREVPASIATILFLLFIVLGPLAAFLGIVVDQAVDISQTAIPWVEKNLGNEDNMLRAERWITERFPQLKDMMPTQAQLFKGIGEVTQKTGGFLVKSVTHLTSGTAAFFLNLFVMLYALFFFLISGRSILDRILSYSPLGMEDSERLVGRFVSVSRATLKGSVTIGIIQGALGGIGFAVAGINGAAFWGTVMAILSVIPGVGTVIVWVPAVIFLFIQGETTTAILLLAWCAGVVGTIDNVLRPRLVGKDAEMPDLLILLSTLGGIFLFGATGFVIGPIICSLFIATWEIYGATFKDVLPENAAEPVLDPAHSENEFDDSSEE